MNLPKKTFVIVIAAVAILIIIAAATPTTKQRTRQNTSSAWYAVHLAGGQTYFGHLQTATDTTLALADAHYFEVYETSPQNQTATSTSFEMKSSPQTIYNLIQRGSDQNMATDHAIFFNRTAVLYWEKLDANAGVVKNIEASKTNK